MTKRELRQTEKRTAHAGGPHNRKKALRTAVDLADHDVERLANAKETRRAEFRRRKEEWTGFKTREDEVPHILPHERRLAGILRLSGILAIALECLLAIGLSGQMGLPWWSGIILALLLAGVLHGGLTMLTRRSQRPRESYSTLKRWLLIPSFVIAVFSLLVLLIVRVARGALLLALLPFLTLSLWTATIGLLLLGAALLVAADIYDWATRDTKEYRGTDLEQRKSLNYRREWLEDLAELEPPGQAAVQPTKAVSTVVITSPASQPSNGSGKAVKQLLPLLLIASCLALTSACQEESGASPQAGSTAPVVGAAISESELTPVRTLDIYIDASDSPNERAYRMAASNIRRMLPHFIQSWNVRSLSVYTFAIDGWNADLRLHLPLPELKVPQIAKAESGEFDGLNNVQEAEDQEQAEKRASATTQARQAYESELANALAAVTEEALMPPVRQPSEPEPNCTDIQGLLDRIGHSGPGSHVAIVLTDGHDTCHHSMKPISGPDGEMTLLIVLVPEKNTKGDESYELRKRSLEYICPFAMIAPHFVESYEAVLNKAMSKRTDQTILVRK